MLTTIMLTDPEDIRANAGNPALTNTELFPAPADGHKYAIGETRTLANLVDFSEFNGQQVKITNIRRSFDDRKAYYIEGEINKFLNWVFESRLV